MSQWTAIVEIDLPEAGVTDDDLFFISEQLNECAVSTTDLVVSAVFSVEAEGAQRAVNTASVLWGTAATFLGHTQMRLLSVEREDS